MIVITKICIDTFIYMKYQGWNHTKYKTNTKSLSHSSGFLLENRNTWLRFLSVAQQQNSGQGRPIVEVSRSHTIRHTRTR